MRITLSRNQRAERTTWKTCRERVIPVIAGSRRPRMEDLELMNRAQIRALERWGCLTPNEARQMKGWPTIPGGDYIDVADDIIEEPDIIRGDDCGPLFDMATRQAMRPFAYGLVFLLLLWGCMAWEKWIGWVMR